MIYDRHKGVCPEECRAADVIVESFKRGSIRCTQAGHDIFGPCATIHETTGFKYQSTQAIYSLRYLLGTRYNLFEQCLRAKTQCGKRKKWKLDEPVERDGRTRTVTAEIQNW